MCNSNRDQFIADVILHLCDHNLDERKAMAFNQLLSTSNKGELIVPLIDADGEELGAEMNDIDFERRQLQMENEVILSHHEQAQNRARILQIKRHVALSSSTKEKRKGLRILLSSITGLFRRSNKGPLTPATHKSDAYSVVAVCDTSVDGNEYLQLLAQKYFHSPSSDISKTSCDLIEESSLAEF